MVRRRIWRAGLTAERVRARGIRVFAEAARYLNRTDAKLTSSKVTVSGPDFSGLREVSVTDVLRHGWSDYRRLAAAGAATRDAPGTVSQVELQELTLNFRYEPAIEVRSDGALLVRIPVSMDLVVTLAEFSAVVSGGCLTGVAVQSMKVHVEITALGKAFPTRSMPLIPEREIQLGHGIPLVSGAFC